jgi:uncharacterized protein DUF4190
MTHSTGYAGQPAVRQGGNGLAIAGLVCGLVGLLVFAPILGTLAIIFGAVAYNNAKRGAGRRGMAIAGIVLGIVDIALWGLLLAVADSGGAFGSL